MPLTLPHVRWYAIPVAPSQHAVGADPRELLVRDSDGKTIHMPLDRDRIVLGRSNACQLCYPDDGGLSRQHLALTRVNGQWQVEDLGSKNGTLVNGNRIEGPALIEEHASTTVILPGAMAEVDEYGNLMIEVGG